VKKTSSGATYLGVLFIVTGISLAMITLLNTQLQEFQQVRNWQNSMREYSLLRTLYEEIEYCLQEEVPISDREWSKLGDLYYRLESEDRDDNHLRYHIWVSQQSPDSAETAHFMHVEFQKSENVWAVTHKTLERIRL